MPPTPDSSAKFPDRIVGVGTSAGGLDALMRMLPDLPRDFSFPLVVVQHLARDHKSQLAPLLQAHTRLRVLEATDGQMVRPGHAFVAPPDHHMEVDAQGRIRIHHEPPVRFSRPSVDVLFGSLARSFGSRSIAVVLTGAGSDGGHGARAVHDAGGLVIAQDRTTSQSFGMPNAAIATGAVDHVLPLEEIGPFLCRLESSVENAS